MSIAENENILIFASHIKWHRAVFHDPMIENREELCAAQGSTRVAGLNCMNHANDVSSHLGDDVL